MTFLVTFFAFGSLAQSDIKYTKTIKIDSETSVKFEKVDLKSPPTNPEFSITHNEFVSKLIDAFSYLDMEEEKKLYQTTLYLIQNGNSIDSSVVIEGENNSFLYAKTDDKWQLKNFTIKGTNISLRNISCGLTSKEVFRLLNKKIKTPVGDGKIWISDTDNKHHFVFTFVKDELVSMQL
ncbi:MAG: hypothetical protein AB7O73_10875 [Bacteroidia bacterium]